MKWLSMLDKMYIQKPALVLCIVITNSQFLPFSAPLLNSNGRTRLEILLSVWVLINLGATVQRCPLRLLLEQSHGLDILYEISTITEDL
jgi:hypothetical protein